MLLVEVALWLAKAAGGQAIKERFARRGLHAQVRSLSKALIESQNERDELAGNAALFVKIVAERDLLQAEVIRLRAENVALRSELAQLRGDAV